LNFIFEFNTHIFYKNEDIFQTKLNELQKEVNNLKNNTNTKFSVNMEKRIINDDDLNNYNELTLFDKLMFFGYINKDSENDKININFNYYYKVGENKTFYDEIIIKLLYMIYFLGITPKIFVKNINNICNKNLEPKIHFIYHV
jgi:hypothetical protein